MKYENPEMEILEFEKSQIFTVDVSGPESGQAPGSGTGTTPWG